MTITAAIVLYAVTWFMTMFVTLPVRLRTQGDMGEVVPGTHPGAPANFNVKRTMLIVTAIATTLWLIITGIILSGAITIDDIDWFDRYDPPAESL